MVIYKNIRAIHLILLRENLLGTFQEKEEKCYDFLDDLNLIGALDLLTEMNFFFFFPTSLNKNPIEGGREFGFGFCPKFGQHRTLMLHNAVPLIFVCIVFSFVCFLF